jgi:hypothetical protein
LLDGVEVAQPGGLAYEVVGEHGAGEPGVVGVEASGGAVREASAVLKIAGGECDGGVVVVELAGGDCTETRCW